MDHKMKAAKAYYDQQLLIKYGIVPLANLLLLRKLYEQKAVQKSRELIMRKHWR